MADDLYCEEIQDDSYDILIVTDKDVDVVSITDDLTEYVEISDDDVLVVSDCVGIPGLPGPPGPQGEQGPKGDTGPQGPPGVAPGGSLAFAEFSFVIPSDTWVVNHGLGTKAIEVQTFMLDGITEIENQAFYVDNDTIRIEWFFPETGIVRLLY